MERSQIQRYRRKRASLIVIAICLLIAAVGAVSCVNENTNAVDGATYIGGAAQIAQGSYVEGIWSDLAQGESFDSAVEKAGFQRIDATNAPVWFEQEIVPLAMFDNIVANEERNLFGLQIMGTQQSVLEKICTHLTKKGWLYTQTDMAGVATFNKSEGECRWAMLECSETSGMCCIVLHIQLG